jgi:tetratricopeptide (TPR) repeat protein
MSTASRIDELLSRFDENPRRYFAPLANEYRKLGDLAQAIALCREYLPGQPGHMSGHIVFGQALYDHGELAEAQAVFEAALALDPENLIALRYLGDIARAHGDALAARRWYGRVLEADPRNDDIAALLASLASRATPVVAPVVIAETPVEDSEAMDASPIDEALTDDAVTRSALSDALGAFATHDPFTGDERLAVEGDAVPALAWPALPAATSDPATPGAMERLADDGDGFDAIDWPDASELAGWPTPSGPSSASADAQEVVAFGPIDEDPPVSAAAMPWLVTAEEEREADEADLLEASPLPDSPAFVTETMAELLVAQGFVARAIGVYEELVARRPDDPSLASRLTELREVAGRAPTGPVGTEGAVRPLVASGSRRTPTRSSTPVRPLPAFTPPRPAPTLAEPAEVPTTRRTAREWLAELASRHVARRTPVAGSAAVRPPTTSHSLATLFADSPLPTDDVAARSLATAFGGGYDPFAFDRFFPDQATPARGPTRSSEAVEQVDLHHGASTSPDADLAKFSDWLNGLSNA